MTEKQPSVARPCCAIVGGGGHARVLIDCIQSAGTAILVGILDADIALHGQCLLDVPVLGGDEKLGTLVAEGVTHFVVGLGGTGDNGPRRRLFDACCSAGLSPLTVRHPSAVVSRWSEVGPGCQLLPGSIVNAGAVLGKNVIVNSGAIVEHDCILEDHVHMATGAKLASTVHVGAGAHIGAGAVVRQCITIGEGAVVGAGAVVIRDVPAGSVVVGVPARSIR